MLSVRTFIYMLLLPEGKTNEAWEHSKKINALPEIVGALDGKILSLFF
jgi:hypothetical protein